MAAGVLRQEPVRTSPESVTSRFSYHFLIIASSLACKIRSNCPGIKLGMSGLVMKRNIQNLLLSALVV